MKNIITLLFTLCSINILSAQLPHKPYEKMKLIGLNPIWYEPSYDPSMVSDSCDGYNRIFFADGKPHIIEKGNVLINVSSIIQNIQDWGPYIEARNKDTGELIWRRRYDRSNLFRQEYLVNSFLNSKDELILLSLSRVKKIDENLETIFCVYEDNTRLLYRRINIENGQLLEEVIPNLEDTTLQRMIVSPQRLGLTSYVFPSENDDEFIYTERLYAYKKDYIKKIKVNKHGRVIGKVDTLLLNSSDQSLNHILKQKGRMISYLDVDYKKKKMAINEYDLSFNLKKKLTLEAPADSLYYLDILDHTDDYTVMRNQFYDDAQFWSYQYIYLFDKEGKLKDRFEVKDAYDRYLYATYYNKKEDNLFLIRNEYIKSSEVATQIVIMKSDKKGGLTYVKKYPLVDSTKLGTVLRVSAFEDDKLILECAEGWQFKKNNLWQFDQLSNANSTIVVDARELGIITSTADVLKNENVSTIVIFPNPTTSEIEIKNLAKISDIEIYDNIGRKIKKLEVSPNEKIDVSFLAPGYYVLKTEIGQGSFIRL